MKKQVPEQRISPLKACNESAGARAGDIAAKSV